MALISLRQLLDHAGEHAYGVPAFNVNNLEQMRAIMLAADATNSPVIVQASAGARKYAGAPFLRHLILAAIEEWPHIPVVMHQDHGTSPDVCQRSIQLGFSSVMMDGSLGEDGKTPTSYEYNVEVTRRTVQMAHACGVSVEGEIGCLGSLETGMAGEEDGVGAEGIAPGRLAHVDAQGGLEPLPLGIHQRNGHDGCVKDRADQFDQIVEGGIGRGVEQADGAKRAQPGGFVGRNGGRLHRGRPVEIGGGASCGPPPVSSGARDGR